MRVNSSSFRRTAVSLGLLAAALLAAGAGEQRHPVTGRQIAPVMGYQGAQWLERPERIREEDPEAALNALDLRPGMIVADVGAGTGYFTRRLAQRVGPEGRVYATDIQPEMLRLLRENIQNAGLSNVEAVLGTATDPGLPAGAIDLALLVDVYHEFSHPQQMLAGLRTALKPQGKLVLLEYRKEDPSIPIREEHKMSVKQVTAELEAEGFRMERVLDKLPRQHILIFRKQVM